ATVTMSPDSLRQRVGDSARLSVALRDAAGSRVFRRPITWSSSNPTAATVDLTGMVKAVGAGKTTITASAGGASGAGKVVVELGGIFRITNVTGGTDLDPTGYVLRAGGVLRGGVGVNTTADLPRLFAGTYSVALSDVACTVRPDGTALVRVTAEHAPGFIDAAWKPDGAQIAAGSRRGGTLELYVMNPDGSGAMPITSNVGYRGRPAWSPDGTKIAFD